MKVHDFRKSLDLSASYADAPWWEQVYRSAFPDFVTMHYVRQDGWSQRAGIDRSVLLKNGLTLWIDEKVRSEEWRDFALERWSDRARRTPGWVQKDLACDYIAYAFIPSSTCYLLPFQQIRKAWRTHGAEWIKRAEDEDRLHIPLKDREYPIIIANNHGYQTESIGVPREELLEALVRALTVTWSRSAAA